MTDATPIGRDFRLRIALRWRDMDMLGHLNQAVYHELLEEARAGFLIALADGAPVHSTFVLARVELDYRTEVRKDHEHVDVDVRVARVGTKSLTLAHDVLLPDGSIAATGASTLVGWDTRARGSRALTSAERRRLTQ